MHRLRMNEVRNSFFFFILFSLLLESLVTLNRFFGVYISAELVAAIGGLISMFLLGPS